MTATAKDAGPVIVSMAGVAHYVSRELAPLEQRLAELEQRVAKSRGLFFRGSWAASAGEVFEENDLVVDRGSLWIALCGTTDKPGTSQSWQLVCKRGKDGRDGRDLR